MAEAEVSVEARDLTVTEFRRYQEYLLSELGIRLADSKIALVRGRLHSRIRKLGLGSYEEYFALATGAGNREELAIMIDRLTTHETRFFREMVQFKWLLGIASDFRGEGRAYRVWSAACSSGEEAYSIAMILSESPGGTGWEVFGTDVSELAVRKAETGLYEIRKEQDIPEEYLKRYCLRGVGSMAGYFTIKPELKRRVTFVQMNLMEPEKRQGLFDVVFLNNVMIYFDQAARVQVVKMVEERIRPGGHLIIGASESLNGITEGFQWIRQSIYRKK